MYFSRISSFLKWRKEKEKIGERLLAPAKFSNPTLRRHILGLAKLATEKTRNLDWSKSSFSEIQDCKKLKDTLQLGEKFSEDFAIEHFELVFDLECTLAHLYILDDESDRREALREKFLFTKDLIDFSCDMKSGKFIVQCPEQPGAVYFTRKELITEEFADALIRFDRLTTLEGGYKPRSDFSIEDTSSGVKILKLVNWNEHRARDAGNAIWVAHKVLSYLLGETHIKSVLTLTKLIKGYHMDDSKGSFHYSLDKLLNYIYQSNPSISVEDKTAVAVELGNTLLDTYIEGLAYDVALLAFRLEENSERINLLMRRGYGSVERAEYQYTEHDENLIKLFELRAECFFVRFDDETARFDAVQAILLIRLIYGLDCPRSEKALKILIKTYLKKSSKDNIEASEKAIRAEIALTKCLLIEIHHFGKYHDSTLATKEMLCNLLMSREREEDAEKLNRYFLLKAKEGKEACIPKYLDTPQVAKLFECLILAECINDSNSTLHDYLEKY